MNFVALIDERNQTLNLKEILVAFLSHRRESNYKKNSLRIKQS